MEKFTPRPLRNLAIIAHVDHGKTTLVDALLKQGQVFRSNQDVGELIMDINPLERERGITILAKNTAVSYKGVKINIIDTPGHADFSGEVERIMNMVDGCLLVVDAVDGPMPQTRYVLQKALNQGVKPLVVINKIDRPEARITEVIEMVQDLFLDLATETIHLDFPILFASAREGYALTNVTDLRVDMNPLFDAILDNVPIPSGDPEGPLQMLVAALDYDNYLGQLAIGRVFRGKIKVKDPVVLLNKANNMKSQRLEKIFEFLGLTRLEVSEAQVGDIVAVAGIDGISIGDTISDIECPEPLPSIKIEEPTVTVTIGVNTSPFRGQKGSRGTSRMLHARLLKELRTNVSLRVETTSSPDEFLVSGRGELHLGVLIETMRREQFDFQVSKPEPVVKIVNGELYEPYEWLTIDTSEEFIGELSEYLSARLAQLQDMKYDGAGNVRLEYIIPTRGLLGFSAFFLETVRGNGVEHSVFTGFRLKEGGIKSSVFGVLVASENGIAVTNGLLIAQGRGDTFIEPGTPVYIGMIIGKHPREEDIVINVCKEKKLTNMRSSNADITKRLSPAIKFTLEEALAFISSDELVEVTPETFRIRKKELSAIGRVRKRRGTSEQTISQ